MKSSGRLLVGTSIVSNSLRDRYHDGNFSSSRLSVTWNREECVFLGDLIASARGTSLGMMDNRSNEGFLAAPIPLAKSPGIVSTAPGGGGC
jgi:hypothetical protein